MSSVDKLIQNRKRKAPIKACFGFCLLFGEAVDHCTIGKLDKNCCYRSLVLLEAVHPVDHYAANVCIRCATHIIPFDTGICSYVVL